MDSVSYPLSDVTQPGKAGMGGLGQRAGHIKVKNRFGFACPNLGQTTPSRLAGSGRPVAGKTIPNEINIDIFVGGPVALEVVEKYLPVRRYMMDLEISQRKREGVIDSNNGRLILEKPLDQPFGEAAPGPILLRAGWRLNLNG